MKLSSRRIHPTALLSPRANLTPDVAVGAFAVLEGEIRLGPGCVIGPRAYLIGPLTMGRDNFVHSNSVIGERPQHLQYRDEPAGVVVGDGNTFRENVTVHRGTTDLARTLIGSGNSFMPVSHVAHDCHVADGCVLDNNALLGGHCVLLDGVLVGGNSAVHQHCRLGRLSVLQDASSATVNVPPFTVQRGRNRVVSVNVVGMRNAGLSTEQIGALRRAFDTVYLQGLILRVALARLESELDSVDVVREFVDFARQSRRGIGRVHDED
jgi:UDP-N-acetylglucosamine acyltransferase